MTCRIADLRNKDVINIHDGSRIGFVGDVEIDTCNACLVSLIIFGRAKCLGIFGHEDDCIIPWKDIELIGEDSILVNCDCQRHPCCSRGVFDSFIGNNDKCC